MKQFTFTANGNTTTVKVENEDYARHLAMVKRWGPPSGMYSSPYRGQGLNLIEVKDNKR